MIDANFLHQLSDLSGEIDQHSQWPEQQLEILRPLGVPGWVIPVEYGGQELSQQQLLEGYEELSAACMTTAFILTQRNAACQRISVSNNEELKQELLPDLASGKTFATVGISHLTTSRQHLRTPAVRTEISSKEIILNGTIPWVTGAAHAQHIVTGGISPQGEQVLVGLPTNLPGIRIEPHAQLMAMTASHTASVAVDNVRLPLRYLISGPTDEVIQKSSGSGTGSLTTSVLAMGLAQRVLHLINEQVRVRAELQEISMRFTAELLALHNDIAQSASHADETPPRVSAAAIRQRANSLALRISQAALGISKGAGFVSGHPAERAVREAMFFLVWSCPQPVVQGVLEELSCREGR